MSEYIDEIARDLPRMTLHGNIPTGTTMALAARVVELRDRVAELEQLFGAAILRLQELGETSFKLTCKRRDIAAPELDKERIKALAAKAVQSGERRVAELESAMREISASFSNDCDEPTDADVLPRHVKAELGKMQEKISAMEHVLRSISRDCHEHHSRGDVRAGQCDGSPRCRVCFANSALTDKP